MNYPSRVSGFSDSEYHRTSALGSSDLKSILRSVAHYEYKKAHPVDKVAYNFGKAFHMAILEPKRFKTDVVMMPKFSGTGAVMRRDTWAIENHGKLIIKEEELEALEEMKKSVAHHKSASKLLIGGEAETSFFWDDPETGLPCKCRPDYLTGVCLDLKSTQDASFESFQKTLLFYNYHLSAAHYLNGLSAVTGKLHETFLIIAVEKEPPHLTQVFEIDFGTLEKGRELCARALLKYKNAQVHGFTHGYSDDIVPINIPPYGFSI